MIRIMHCGITIQCDTEQDVTTVVNGLRRVQQPDWRVGGPTGSPIGTGVLEGLIQETC